jgi:phage terminase large subunit
LILEIEVARKLRPLLQPSRYKGVYGGRGGSKSHFFAEQLIARCLAKETRVVCIREVQNSIRDSVRQLLVDKIQKLGVGHEFEPLEREIRCLKNGSLIIFRGMQEYNADNIKSLEGYNIAWVEEAQTLSARSLEMLRPTIRASGSELWFSWNPRHKHDPVDEFFRGVNKHPEAICVEVSWRDNPWFPEELKREKDFDYQRDPVMADHVWGGGYEVIAKGAYYAKLIYDAQQEGRIGKVPHNPRMLVHTAWDLGIGDPTAIWFVQQNFAEVRLIDYYENSGCGLDHYVKVLRERNYNYGEHILPHDVQHADLSTGKSRLQTLAELGVTGRVLNRDSVDDGIAAVRMLLPTCWFDEAKCERGIEALRQYRTEYDDKVMTFKNRPLHDWTSHAADAFRYLARGLPDQSFAPPKRDRYRRSAGGGESWMSV